MMNLECIVSAKVSDGFHEVEDRIDQFCWKQFIHSTSK